MKHKTLISLFFAVSLFLQGLPSHADKAQDREDCTEQLTGLATCLPYVQGQAGTPTPDCCGGLKQVLKNNKKCLCVIVRDRNDPDLGLQINVTRALSLPSVCHAPADVTKCPGLLHMDPNSPEAQVFYQLAKGSKPSATSPSLSPAGFAPAPSEDPSGARATSGLQRNEGSHNIKKSSSLEMLAYLMAIGFGFIFGI